MELTNIISIYKGKGERTNLENERGIFIMNIFSQHSDEAHLQG